MPTPCSVSPLMRVCGVHLCKPAGDHARESMYACLSYDGIMRVNLCMRHACACGLARPCVCARVCTIYRQITVCAYAWLGADVYNRTRVHTLFRASI